MLTEAPCGTLTYLRMKKLRLILLGALLAESLLLLTAQAQVYSPRRLTRSIVPQPGATNAPARPGAPAVQTPSASPARPVTAPAAVRIVQPTVDPAKAKAAKEEALRRTVEFQKKRAEEGSESAQYELGMRYLKGDGLEKNETAARRWLALSSKNGYGPATRKLEDLDKPAPAPAPSSAKEEQ